MVFRQKPPKLAIESASSSREPSLNTTAQSSHFHLSFPSMLLKDWGPQREGAISRLFIAVTPPLAQCLHTVNSYIVATYPLYCDGVSKASPPLKATGLVHLCIPSFWQGA